MPAHLAVCNAVRCIVLYGPKHYSGSERDSFADVNSYYVRQLFKRIDSYTGWTNEARNDKREELRRVLTEAVTQEGEEVYYYQGLHDIAAVLLFVVGQESADDVLCALSTAHLRDFTRSVHIIFHTK